MMSRKRNKGLDRRSRLMMLMWLSLWLCGSLWSGLHGGNGVLTAVWHGFLVMAGCMGVYLLGGLLSILPEEQRRYNERVSREKEDSRNAFQYLDAINEHSEKYDSPNEMDLDISIDDDVDFDITVNNPILDLAEYKEEKERYLSSEHIDRYRLARLREFIRDRVNGCDVFDSLPTLLDDPLLQGEIEKMV